MYLHVLNSNSIDQFYALDDLFSGSVLNYTFSLSLLTLIRWDQDILTIWLWKGNMQKRPHCVPNCCGDQLQHGKGVKFDFNKLFQIIILMTLFFIYWICVISYRWVFHFAQLRQLPVLVPHIPTENPKLRDTVYEVCYFSVYRMNWFFVMVSPLQ